MKSKKLTREQLLHKKRNDKFRRKNPNYWKVWRIKNPKKFKDYQAKYGKSKKGKKVHRRAQARYAEKKKNADYLIRKKLNAIIWKKNHPNYWKDWHKNNPDYNKKWRKKNPDYFNNYNKTDKGKRLHRIAMRNHRQRKKLLATVITPQQILVKVVQHKP